MGWEADWRLSGSGQGKLSVSRASDCLVVPTLQTDAAPGSCLAPQSNKSSMNSDVSIDWLVTPAFA